MIYWVIHVVRHGCNARAIAASRDKLLVQKMFLGQIVSVVFFLIYQTINLSKVGQPYQFYCFWGHFDIVTVIYCGMFCRSYSKLKIILSSQIVYLHLKSQCPRNPDQHLLHVFCIGVFCAPILRIFLDAIIISRYCLKFFIEQYLHVLNERRFCEYNFCVWHWNSCSWR